MSDILLKIGTEIRNERITKKYSKKDILYKLKINHKYLDKIENGTLDDELDYRNVIRYLRVYLHYFNIDSKKILTEYKNFHLQNKSNKKKINFFFYNNIKPSKKLLLYSFIISLLTWILFLYIENRSYHVKIYELDSDIRILF